MRLRERQHDKDPREEQRRDRGDDPAAAAVAVADRQKPHHAQHITRQPRKHPSERRGSARQEQAEQARWKEYLDQFGIVRDVLALDAFARCWVHEDVFYERVGKLVDEAKRPGYARLLATWQADW